MKTAIVKFMSAVTFVLVVALNLAAQPVGQTVDSLEWRCARSSAIVRGVVKDFRVPDDQVDEPYTPEWEFTVSVSETIKGPGQKEIVFRHAYDRRVVADLEKIKGNKTSFLLFLDKSEKPKLIHESYPGTFPVPNPQFSYNCWSNGSRVQFQNVDAYVEKLKQVVAENAKFDIEISHEFAYGDLFSVRVPLDERAETMARKY